MSDYIKREEAVKAALTQLWNHTTNGYLVAEKIISQIKALPAAPVREVVTCGECRHKGWIQEPCHGKSVDYCRELERCVSADFFCGLGERADMRPEEGGAT